MGHRESLAQRGGLTAHRFANGDLGKKLWLDLVSIQARESLEGAVSTRTVRLAGYWEVCQCPAEGQWKTERPPQAVKGEEPQGPLWQLPKRWPTLPSGG